ncbi:MAG: hypothetical protein KF886_18495 [Candidatus Hydrogenedentes bacterium]|nr:hypothetical protein [Candidatus Hydrogenedentota bacterium]
MSQLCRAAAGAGAIAIACGTALAHPGHVHPETRPDQKPLVVAQAGDAAAPSVAKGVTGQGDLVFKVLHTSAALPEAAHAGLNAAHGGFAVDRRPGKGEVYFALPNVGIIRISADLNTIEVLPTDGEMAATNMHNTTIWYADGDKTYLTFPGNATNKVYTTTADGALVDTLDAPTADTAFDNETVSAYFDNPENKFVPTDVEVLDNRFYVATGYSSLDFVLTADVETESGVSSEWAPFAFGGKGDGPGQFGTGHGITVDPAGNITVADRPNSELESFTKDGAFLGTLPLPKGSLPCDVDYQSGYTVVGCLKGPDENLGAPIYIVKDGEVVSTIMIKEDLGLEKFTHIHNAVMVERDGTFYIIAQAWNPGDFAILEQVK